MFSNKKNENWDFVNINFIVDWFLQDFAGQNLLTGANQSVSRLLFLSFIPMMGYFFCFFPSLPCWIFFKNFVFLQE